MTTGKVLAEKEAPPVLAFDVGGTDTKSGIVLTDGSVVGPRRTATPRVPGAEGDAVVSHICELADGYRREYPDQPFEAVGLIVPGLVDERAGVGILSTNLGWRNFPFTARTEARLGMPVGFGHDVGSAGEAEFRSGAAQGSDNAVVVVNGTGIAAAVFCDGRRVRGGGHAGELGHALVPDPDRPAESVILESVGSAGAITARYCRITGREVDGAREVLKLSQSGDLAASRVWREAVDALAFSLAQCVSILGSDTIVMGGGLSQAGEALLVPLREAVADRLHLPTRPRIVAALLGDNAGLVGAAVRARDVLGERAGHGSLQ
jgi:glucokinase